MIQFWYCIMMLVPLVGLPALVFVASPVLGIILGVVGFLLAIPIVLSAAAHLDLHRAQSRYGLEPDELDEFSRLVPRLALQPEYVRMPRKQSRELTRRAAAEMIRQRRQAAR